MGCKKGLIFICLIICLFSIVSVCASDVNETVVANDDQIGDEEVLAIEEQEVDEVGVTEKNDLSATTGTFTDLNNFINDNNDSNIYLNQNYKYDSKFDNKFINGIEIHKKNICINGNGNIIDANHHVGVFKGAYNVTFKNIIFLNGQSDYGGAIYSCFSLNTAINCTFINNTASANGGATSYVHCINCTFINNTAPEGGAIYCGNASNCSFINNKASKKGGAIYFYEQENFVYINNSFINCSANNKGGAIFVCTLDDNTNKKIYSHIKNCKFQNCYSTDIGGAIAISSYDEKIGYNMNLSNCNFTNCYAHYAGAIEWESYNGICTDCNFINCFSVGGGTLSCARPVFILLNCTFVNCICELDSGAFLYGSNSNGNIMKCCTFINNTSIKSGGGACTFFGNIYDCIFINNTAYYGGAIELVESNEECNIYNSVFINNKATIRQGGAIYSDGNENYIVNCIFKDNIALLDCNISHALINSSGFTDNSSIFFKQKNLGAIINCSFNKIVTTITSTDMNLMYGSNKTLSAILKDENNSLLDNKTIIFYLVRGNITKKYVSNTLNGTALILDELSKLNSGIWELTIIFNGDTIYSSSKTHSKITINVLPTVIKSDSIITSYNEVKYLVAALTDNEGNAIVGQNLSINLNGIKYSTTDINGQVKLSTKGLAPNTYTASITFAGNNNYAKSTKTVKVTVKKATPKLTAKAKTFKKSVKTKKYAVTLKDNTGKVMKKVKLTLKIKGKPIKPPLTLKVNQPLKLLNLPKKALLKQLLPTKEMHITIR